MSAASRPTEPSLLADKSPRAFREIGEALTVMCFAVLTQLSGRKSYGTRVSNGTPRMSEGDVGKVNVKP